MQKITKRNIIFNENMKNISFKDCVEPPSTSGVGYSPHGYDSYIPPEMQRGNTMLMGGGRYMAPLYPPPWILNSV